METGAIYRRSDGLVVSVELRDLRWAIVAAQHRSLRQAAEVLDIRQSTLSRNETKSAVASVFGRKFLGYGFWVAPGGVRS
jgi:hypothetical protein